MIRQEKAPLFEQISHVLTKAFEKGEHKTKQYDKLVERLRQTESFIPELALVYLEDNTVVGYVCYSECFIGDHPILALGPVAVLPAYQGRSIGTQLIEASIERAKWSGFSAVITYGDDAYFTRFGFENANMYNILATQNCSEKPLLIQPLYKGALTNISGVVTHALPFSSI